MTNTPEDPLLAWTEKLPFVSIRRMPADTPGLELDGKQWLSRLVELQNLPYDVTYAVDAGSLVCHPETLLRAFREAARDDADFDVAIQTQTRSAVRIYPLGGFLFMRRTAGTQRWLATWLRMQRETPERRDDQMAMRDALRYEDRHNGLRIKRLHPRLSGYLRHLSLDDALPSQSRFHDGYIGLIHWTVRWGSQHGHAFVCPTVNANPHATRYFILDRVGDADAAQQPSPSAADVAVAPPVLSLREHRDASGCRLESCDLEPFASAAENFFECHPFGRHR